MSESDYIHTKELVEDLWQLSHGLFIIVLEDGYRIVKAEHKTKARANTQALGVFLLCLGPLAFPGPSITKDGLALNFGLSSLG